MGAKKLTRVSDASKPPDRGRIYLPILTHGRAKIKPDSIIESGFGGG
jgi:hypothetical protein